jgi:hypothetical protein
MIQVNALEYYQMKYDILIENEDKLTPEQKDDLIVTTEVLIQLHKANARGHNISITLEDKDNEK